MKTEYKPIYEFSTLTRIFHWIRAISIFLLIATGFYLAYPFLAPNNFTWKPIGFLYALMRSWHLIFGFLLISVSIFRVYIFLFSKECRMERNSFADLVNPVVWWKILKTYLLIGIHPHMRGSYNPIQLVTYIGVMFLIFAIALTGLILYTHVYHDGLGGFLSFLRPLEVPFGGIANVRAIHHILTWAFIIFLPVHIYMAVWNSTRYPGAGIDTIISGYKFEKDQQH